MKEMGQVLFPKRAVAPKSKPGEGHETSLEELPGELALGDAVLVKKTGRQGQVLGFKGKMVVVRIGKVPMQVSRTDLKRVRLPTDKATPEIRD